MNRTKLRRKAAVQNKSKQVTERNCKVSQEAKASHRARALKRSPRKRTPGVTKAKKVLSKIIEKHIFDAIKSISASSNTSSSWYPLHEAQLERKLSDDSVVYIGTAYLSFPDMPRRESTVDLTRSDSTLSRSWESNYNLDNYDISGDNIFDELHLKDHPASSSASIFTIFPPKPQSLFSTPSEEMCACQRERPRKSIQKRNLSLTDITSHSVNTRSKKRAISRSKLEKIDRDSSDFVWKLKKSYPLSNGLCISNTEDNEGNMNMSLKASSEMDLMSIMDDIQRDFNISDSQHNALIEDLRESMVPSISAAVHSSINDV